MKPINLLLCFFILSTFASSSDASKYFDSLGSKLYSVGNSSEAMDYFNKSLVQNSSNVDAWIHKGNAFRALKDNNASVISYNQAIALDGKNAVALSGLADTYSVSKDYGNGSRAASELTRLYPKNKGYWLKNGTLLQMQGHFEDASADFDKAILLDAKYKDAMYRKAISELAANNIDQAIELLDKVIAIDAKYKQAYNLKGQALEAKGRYEGAIAEYDKALKIDAKWTIAMTNKMHALLLSDRQKEATDIFLRI